MITFIRACLGSRRANALLEAAALDGGGMDAHRFFVWIVCVWSGFHCHPVAAATGLPHETGLKCRNNGPMALFDTQSASHAIPNIHSARVLTAEQTIVGMKPPIIGLG